MEKRTERGDYKTRAYFLIKDVLLSASESHLRADEIYDILKKKGERVGLTTVYRQLSRLTEEGFVRKTATESGSSSYSLLGAHCSEHYHLVCSECGAVDHLSCDHVEEFMHHIALRHGFSVSPAKTTLYGLCAACARKRKRKDSQ